jgi:hypothetical protein
MGHLLKLKYAHSPLNVRILSLTSVPFTLTTVQVPNLALTHTKQIQCTVDTGNVTETLLCLFLNKNFTFHTCLATSLSLFLFLLLLVAARPPPYPLP